MHKKPEEQTCSRDISTIFFPEQFMTNTSEEYSVTILSANSQLVVSVKTLHKG